jgi:hypothetical protein
MFSDTYQTIPASREMARPRSTHGRLHCEQVALTRKQVTDYNLPTRPTKTEHNFHARHFSDAESVELDALEPDDLREMLRDAIEAHVDLRALETMCAAEESERLILSEMATNFTEDAP